MDWSEYQAVYMGELFRKYGQSLSRNIPHLMNTNPPMSEPGGTDYWLTRVAPDRWEVVAYGHTNWIGAVSHDDSAFRRYLTLIRRTHGPNLEENWGFSRIYDARYQLLAIPFYQTLVAAAAGATGFNVYTGVGAAHWDNDLDRFHPKPYPDCSPIAHTGELTDKFRALQLLTGYIGRFGKEIPASATEHDEGFAPCRILLDEVSAHTRGTKAANAHLDQTGETLPWVYTLSDVVGEVILTAAGRPAAYKTARAHKLGTAITRSGTSHTYSSSRGPIGSCGIRRALGPGRSASPGHAADCA
jgi:hypothetical protein